VSPGEAKGPWPPQIFAKMVILCFERRFSKQTSVIRIKSYTLPPSNFWAGYATAPRLNVPAYRDPVKRCNFRKADWKRFCFLTTKSVKRLPSPDITNIEKAYQELRTVARKFSVGGLDTLKAKTQLIYSVSIWGAWSFVGTKPPVATRLQFYGRSVPLDSIT